MPTFNNDILPDTSGRSLGAQDARWDIQCRNLNISGLLTGNFAGLAVFTLKPKIVPWSATPNLDGLDSSAGFKIVLNGGTAPTFNNIGGGRLVAVIIIQDAVGGRSWAWPANVRGGMDVGQGPNEVSAQLLWSDGITLWGFPGWVI